MTYNEIEKQREKIHNIFSTYGFKLDSIERIIESLDEQILNIDLNTLEKRLDNLSNDFTLSQLHNLIRWNPRIIMQRTEIVNNKIKFFKQDFNFSERNRIFLNAPRVLTQKSETTETKTKKIKSILKDDYTTFICFSPRVLIQSEKNIPRYIKRYLKRKGLESIRSIIPYLLSHAAQ